jgi:hypothetical protein
MSPKIVRGVATISLIVGAISLFYLQFSGAADVAAHNEALGEWGNSSWVLMTKDWALQGTLMLHYIRGFRPVHTALTAALFVVIALSSARYVLVVYAIFACFVALSRGHRRWPTARIVVILTAVAVVWFPLKNIRISYSNGDGPADILRSAVNYTTSALGEGGQGGDTIFLDEAAVAMSLVDEHGEYFYGRTFAPLLVLPIPRPWWPDKPATNQYLRDISTPARPMGTIGMVATIVGEGYANCGYLGVVLFPLVAAYGYGKAYYAAMRQPHNSTVRFSYLLVACLLIQVLRDGLISSVIFILVGGMPMVVVCLLHLRLPHVNKSGVRRRGLQRVAPLLGETLRIPRDRSTLAT